ncbi:hypothetical protein GGR26_001317 [Lewinella marina]|uniref:DUF1761 domain-containing protein n=1 Tax=Neolewinella marina TaxID=438751 RepID=A0A2G0CFJ5_9BACT|nr:DUF1761 domain-containing protein [Neolewinella marina]NJB85572.1 hypothetical protein [Neolewinella marina]PHK98744.1 hypothetical protein CGL56_09770 [Neolewinella marina]
MNWWLYPLTALIPMLVGSIYYNEKVVGGMWMKATGLDAEKLQRGNMAVIFGMAYLFSVLIALLLPFLVIHQTSIDSLFMMQEGYGVAESALMQQLETLDTTTGMYDLHRSFGHGFFHGALMAIAFVGSILAINALFERRRWNYVLIHVGYWTITLGLMGGVLCAFLKIA